MLVDLLRPQSLPGDLPHSSQLERGSWAARSRKMGRPAWLDPELWSLEQGGLPKLVWGALWDKVPDF